MLRDILMNKQSQGKIEADLAIELVKQNNRAEAGTHLNNALELYESIEDKHERATELEIFALLADHLQFPDIGLMAINDAIELWAELGDKRKTVEGHIEKANLEVQLGSEDQALSSYRDSLQLCIKEGFFSNAASVSTNIAGIIGNRGKIDEALEMLFQSIEYLKKAPFPDTEITTRMALIQLLEHKKESPEKIFSIANPLNRFSGKIHPQYMDMLNVILGQVINRYLQSNPDSSAEDIKKNFLSNLI